MRFRFSARRIAPCLAAIALMAGCATAEREEPAPAALNASELNHLFEQGHEAERAGNHAAALGYYVQMAELNSVEGMVLAAHVLEKSIDTPNHLTRAFEYYSRAADRGDVGSQYAVAKALFRGDGVPRDSLRGLEKMGQLARRDASALDPADAEWVGFAELDLANEYIAGAVVDHDYARAFQLLSAAARQGIAPAQFRLGECYELGLGTASNPYWAYVWYNLAADAEGMPASYGVNRRRAAKTLDPASLARAQDESAQLLQQMHGRARGR